MESEITQTLESEVKVLVNGFPYWAKYIAEKVLAGKILNDDEYEIALSYLLEDLKLVLETDKPELSISYSNSSRNYKQDLRFQKLESVEGVNALSENQKMTFNPNLTIIFGSNGSGKSGYVRLFKKAFYSKAPEEILANIHKVENKPVNAKFTFQSKGSEYTLDYPLDSTRPEFEQFAVFDGKSVVRHLDNKNPFEFKPLGLSFFSQFTEALKILEAKLNSEIQLRNSINNFPDLFDGDSIIKQTVQNLSAQTNIDDLKKLTPFSEEDRVAKELLERQYDDLLLVSKTKEKEIQKLVEVRQLLVNNKTFILPLNTYFTKEHLEYIRISIEDFNHKSQLAKNEGIENFKTDKIKNIGSIEWKEFITSAEEFAKTQHTNYPIDGDNCLLCQQPIGIEAQLLIQNYWAFIKSFAEQNLSQAKNLLVELKTALEKLSFDLFQDENILTQWLLQNYPDSLKYFRDNLSAQKNAATQLIVSIEKATVFEQNQIEISVTVHDALIDKINQSIKVLQEDEQIQVLNKILYEKTGLIHKEKFNLHFPKFENFVQKQQWIAKARALNWTSWKKSMTDWEKYLSGKYFNQTYVDKFNEECNELNGSFGIEVLHSGSGGTSFRQLMLKGKNPTAILSEGQQKVIALADFIAETHLSIGNRGIIFDDPVTSLDETRKKEIAVRLARESQEKQVVIFTHDLIFVSNLITHCEDNSLGFSCHWIENRSDNPGQIWLNNSPSFEKEYRNAEPARRFYIDSNKENCSPSQREYLLRNGFTALRTCYEVLVINDLFKNVVQRYNERVSVDSLMGVYFDDETIVDLLDSFAQCCRYMEGHTHSDKYAYKKPEPINLNEEITRYELIRSKIRKSKRPNP